MLLGSHLSACEEAVIISSNFRYLSSSQLQELVCISTSIASVCELLQNTEKFRGHSHSLEYRFQITNFQVGGLVRQMRCREDSRISICLLATVYKSMFTTPPWECVPSRFFLACASVFIMYLALMSQSQNMTEFWDKLRKNVKELCALPSQLMRVRLPVDRSMSTSICWIMNAAFINLFK